MLKSQFIPIELKSILSTKNPTRFNSNIIVAEIKDRNSILKIHAEYFN